jgi:hypothetical protein
MKTLAVELEQLRVELRKTASSREDDKQVALLGEAAYEAKNGNGNGIAAALSNAGMNVLKMARDIGTDVAAKSDCGVDEGLKLRMRAHRKTCDQCKNNAASFEP